MPALMARLVDENGVCRQKALMALSCLLRHNQEGLAAFVQVRPPRARARAVCGQHEMENHVATVSGDCVQSRHASDILQDPPQRS